MLFYLMKQFKKFKVQAVGICTDDIHNVDNIQKMYHTTLWLEHGLDPSLQKNHSIILKNNVLFNGFISGLIFRFDFLY